MKPILTFLVLSAALAAGTAQAQIKCWNEGGKRVCGDTPPAGAKTTTVRGTTPSAEPAAAPAAPAAGAAAKDAPKGPRSPAEQEQDYRKRQQEAQKAAEKTAAEEREQAAKRENCERARQQLQTIDSGVRIRRTDARGEPYVLDDAQREAEAARMRQLVSQNCA